jgi:hypothetical protein
MKKDNIFKEVEAICKDQHIMETHYGVLSFNDNQPYFTSSQEQDIKEMINDGLNVNDIISIIKQW